MDKRRLRAADVATDLHIETQTVRNWRASGIPLRRQAHIADYMTNRDRIDKGDPIDVIRARPLIVEATPEQYRNWESAALASGQTLSQWAANGLDKIANKRGYGAPSNTLVSLKVAEPDDDEDAADEKSHRPHSSSGAAEIVSPTKLNPKSNDGKAAS